MNLVAIGAILQGLVCSNPAGNASFVDAIFACPRPACVASNSCPQEAADESSSSEDE